MLDCFRGEAHWKTTRKRLEKWFTRPTRKRLEKWFTRQAHSTRNEELHVMVSRSFTLIVDVFLECEACDLHKIIPAHMPRQFILLTGKYLIPRAKTFLVESTDNNQGFVTCRF